MALTKNEYYKRSLAETTLRCTKRERDVGERQCALTDWCMFFWTLYWLGLYPTNQVLMAHTGLKDARLIVGECATSAPPLRRLTRLSW